MTRESARHADDLTFRCPTCAHWVYPENGGCGHCSCILCGRPRSDRTPGLYVCDDARCRVGWVRRAKEAEAHARDFLQPVYDALDAFGRETP